MSDERRIEGFAEARMRISAERLEKLRKDWERIGEQNARPDVIEALKSTTLSSECWQPFEIENVKTDSPVYPIDFLKRVAHAIGCDFCNVLVISMFPDEFRNAMVAFLKRSHKPV